MVFLTFCRTSANRILIEQAIVFPGIAVYSGTKFAVNGLSESLRGELHRYGVHVCCLNLGDYAKLTRIMSRQQEHMEEMKRHLDQWQKRFYGEYLDKFQQSASANFGLTSPTDFRRTLLHHHFRRALLDQHPPTELISASLIQVIGYFFWAHLPACVQNWLISYIIRMYVN